MLVRVHSRKGNQGKFVTGSGNGKSTNINVNTNLNVFVEPKIYINSHINAFANSLAIPLLCVWKLLDKLDSQLLSFSLWMNYFVFVYQTSVAIFLVSKFIWQYVCTGKCIGPEIDSSTVLLPHELQKSTLSFGDCWSCQIDYCRLYLFIKSHPQYHFYSLISYCRESYVAEWFPCLAFATFIKLMANKMVTMS